MGQYYDNIHDFRIDDLKCIYANRKGIIGLPAMFALYVTKGEIFPVECMTLSLTFRIDQFQS